MKGNNKAPIFNSPKTSTRLLVCLRRFIDTEFFFLHTACYCVLENTSLQVRVSIIATMEFLLY